MLKTHQRRGHQDPADHLSCHDRYMTGLRAGADRTVQHVLLNVICLLFATAIADAQNSSGDRARLAAQSTSENPASLKTERQRWTALKDAKRLSDKAEAYQRQGKTDEAERTAEKALALEEQALGPWHIELAHRLDQVADRYTVRKKERSLKPLYERARAIRERALDALPEVC